MSVRLQDGKTLLGSNVCAIAGDFAGANQASHVRQGVIRYMCDVLLSGWGISAGETNRAARYMEEVL